MPGDQCFDLRTHFAVAGQDHLERHALLSQAARGLQQQQLAFLFTQAPHADQPRRGRHRHRRHVVKGPLQATMHDLDPSPVRVVDPTIQLATPIGADGRDKRRAPDFLAQMNELRLVELFRAMHGKTVRRPAKGVGQHHHFGRVGAEMGVHMPGAECLHPRQDAARFEQIDQMVRPGSIGALAHAQRQPQRRKKPFRLGAQHLERRLQQCLDAALQHILGLAALGLVLGVHQLGIPASQRDALYLKALAFQRQDLATNEAMADLRVLIDEVSDTHGHPAFVVEFVTAGPPTVVQ
ncbi:hypothetical protein D3C73_752560 [compost metagenome]